MYFKKTENYYLNIHTKLAVIIHKFKFFFFLLSCNLTILSIIQLFEPAAPENLKREIPTECIGIIPIKNPPQIN